VSRARDHLIDGGAVTPAWQRAWMDELRVRSGDAVSDDFLVAFLYRLLRDHTSPGEVERIVMDLSAVADGTVFHFTNGWLAAYAEDLATRLKATSDAVSSESADFGVPLAEVLDGLSDRAEIEEAIIIKLGIHARDIDDVRVVL
jgi:hypothetical protein